MVKSTRYTSLGAQHIRSLKVFLKKFGRTLTLRKKTISVNTEGEVTGITNSDTTFVGDLQFGVFLDPKLVSAGYLSIGEGVLYVNPEDSLSISKKDLIIVGNTGKSGTYTAWEVLRNLEAPLIEDDRMHLSYVCVRRDDVVVS